MQRPLQMQRYRLWFAGIACIQDSVVAHFNEHKLCYAMWPSMAEVSKRRNNT